MSTSCSVSLFLSDYRKQDNATTNSHSKRLIEILRERNLLASSLCTIWENTDDCAEQFICDSAL